MVAGSREERLANRPNILFFHVDNLGFGELSCYSGGPFRGATTSRVDAFAADGFRLTNYCPESQCTPTRSALLTGRHAIRSGTHSVPIGSSGGWGLVAWERTLGDLLTDAGYACAAYGKWHVGEGAGRWPTDHGFAEWYGPPRTYDEALWPTDPWYDPGRDPVSRMVQIKRGESDVTEGDQLPWTFAATVTRSICGARRRSSGRASPVARRFSCTSTTR